MRLKPITCSVCGAKCACRKREFDICCGCACAHHKHKRRIAPSNPPAEAQVEKELVSA